MKKHIVKQGECLARIAEQYDIRPWTLIYDAAENAEFRNKRPNPNVLFPGDELVIPDPRQKQESGQTEQKHRFEAKAARGRLLRMQFRDEEGNPLDRFAWELRAGAELIGEGETDAEGSFEVELSDDVTSAVLEMGGYEWPVQIDHMDPVTRVAGVQKRLSNLGCDPGAADGRVGERTTAAVMRFQSRTEGLEPTGKIDDDTRRALLDAHDGDTDLRDAEERMSAQSEEPPPPPAGNPPGPGGAKDDPMEGIEAPFPCELTAGWASLAADSESERTLAVQQRLAYLGIDPGPLDGLLGPRTRAAVEEFQTLCTECAGSPPEIIDSGPVDGIVGPLTRRALESAAGTGPYA